MSHELTLQEIDQFRNDFDNSRNEVVSRAAMRSGVLEASFNPTVTNRLNDVFSVEVETDNVTNQMQSGRCWLFATLNTLRHDFGKKYKAKNFTLSQAYNFFWDKIERANIFYDAIIDSADKPLDDRTVKAYMNFAGSDGGQWAMAASLVKKYGVVPTNAMPESFNTNHTAGLADALARKERKDALVLRKLVQAGKTEEVEKKRKEFLSEIYRMTAIAVGEPPKTFDLEYRDDDKKLHLDKNLTPVEFFNKYWDINFDDYVCLTNAPDHEYGKLYSLPFEDNVNGGLPITFLNVPIEYLKEAAVKQLKDGESVWFGNDVLKEMDRKTGYLDTELYKTDELFDVDTYMTKAERLATGEGEVSHAMTLVGVDLDKGEIRKWKVENSWSEKSGRKGYFTMSDKWFDEFVYEVVVRKEFLTDDQKKLAESKPTPLPAWDSLSSINFSISFGFLIKIFSKRLSLIDGTAPAS